MFRTETEMPQLGDSIMLEVVGMDEGDLIIIPDGDIMEIIEDDDNNNHSNIQSNNIMTSCTIWCEDVIPCIRHYMCKTQWEAVA